MRSHEKVETSYQLKIINPRKSHGLNDFLLRWFDKTQKIRIFRENLCDVLLLDFLKFDPSKSPNSQFLRFC